MSACIVPIPAESEDIPDGGTTNAFPVIAGVLPEMPGPFFLNPSQSRQFSMVLADTDISDTLYLRIFRDYSSAGPTPTIVLDAQVPPGNDVMRSYVNETTAEWCAGVGPTGFHIFDVVVADRDWDDTATQNPKRTTLEGGRQSFRSWLVQCSPSPQ